jgi:hypothetical protein
VVGAEISSVGGAGSTVVESSFSRLRRHVVVDDQGAAVSLSVEPDVVDLDPAELPRVNWAAGMPARAEVGGGDVLNCGGGC